MEFKDFPLSEVGVTVDLVGGIWAGGDQAYLVYFPDSEIAMGTIHDVPLNTDEWKALLRQSDLVETTVLSKDVDGKLYRAVVRKCQRKVDQQVAWNVYRRDGYACRYCGIDQAPLTVDHLVLWEEGGPTIEENLVASCKRCNKGRGNMPYAEWLKSRRYQNYRRGITDVQHNANVALVETLDKIPRVIKVRKR